MFATEPLIEAKEINSGPLGTTNATDLYREINFGWIFVLNPVKQKYHDTQ